MALEIREVVAIVSALVAVVTLGFNWVRARGWQQRISYRDELDRFATNPQTKEVFAKATIESAAQASAYLSLELAETARRQTARRAARANARPARSILWYGLAVLVLAPLYTWLGLSTWGDRGTPLGPVSSVFFLFIAVVTVFSYVKHVLEIRRSRGDIARLKELRRAISDDAALTSRDPRAWH